MDGKGILEHYSKDLKKFYKSFEGLLKDNKFFEG